MAQEPDIGALAIAHDLMLPPIAVRESDDLHSALEAILKHGVRELVVLDDKGGIVGFLDEAEITRVYHGSFSQKD
jgi:CIC family chloride channel protein